jgi:hypothetical protein
MKKLSTFVAVTALLMSTFALIGCGGDDEPVGTGEQLQSDQASGEEVSTPESKERAPVTGGFEAPNSRPGGDRSDRPREPISNNPQ